MKISLKQGSLQGIESISRPSGKPFYSFLRIPYAKPPINLLRFKAPQPHEGWTGILDASKNETRCPQTDVLDKWSFVGDEDCLYINVHVPEDPHSIEIPKPVMVFVHGGGFSSGYGDMYKADYLINYDVILVTFNYRLNVFGFLNLDVEECAGNAGLKDQAMAFSWIRENIAAFGGDPSNVTAFGESAGAASVHYLMLCPASKGLFDKAILQSGSAICSWAFTDDKLKHAFDLGKILGCRTADRKQLVHFLLEVSAHDLLEARNILLKEMSKREIIRLPFVPSIEECSSADTLLRENPIHLLDNVVEIPVISGLNELEGLILVFGKSMRQLSWLNDQFTALPDDIRPFVRRFPRIEQKVKEFYFGAADKAAVSEQTFPQLIRLFSDVAFGNNFYDVTRPLVQNGAQSPVFVYKFAYESQLNIVKQLATVEFPFCHLEGPCHADELFYLFVVDAGFNIFHPVREKMIDSLCTWWTNFAKFGSPGWPWVPSTFDKPRYLNITSAASPQMKDGLMDEARMNFWSDLRRELKLSTDPTSSKL